MSLIFPDGSRTVNVGPYAGGGTFRSGQAQPRPPQQQGTPYGQQFDYTGWLQQGRPDSGAQAWQQAGSPKNGQQSQTGGFNYGQWLQSPDRYSEQSQAAWQAAGSPKGRPSGMQSYAQQPGFTQTMQTPYGAMEPNQYYQQRDAFIQTANDQMGQYMSNAGTYQGYGAPSQSWGQPPQFNPQQMWGQAGQMVEQGWQNPMRQQSEQQRPGLVDIDSPMYAPGGPWGAPQQQAPVYSGDFALRRDPNMPSEPPPPGYEWARSKKGTYSLKRVSPGMAQPIPPQSVGTPYGDPGLMMPDPTPAAPAAPSLDAQVQDYIRKQDQSASLNKFVSGAFGDRRNDVLGFLGSQDLLSARQTYSGTYEDYVRNWMSGAPLGDPQAEQARDMGRGPTLSREAFERNKANIDPVAMYRSLAKMPQQRNARSRWDPQQRTWVGPEARGADAAYKSFHAAAKESGLFSEEDMQRLGAAYEEDRASAWRAEQKLAPERQKAAAAQVAEWMKADASKAQQTAAQEQARRANMARFGIGAESINRIEQSRAAQIAENQRMTDLWRQQHRQQVAAPANKNWLAGMSPDNRRIYRLMQGMT